MRKARLQNWERLSISEHNFLGIATQQQLKQQQQQKQSNVPLGKCSHSWLCLHLSYTSSGWNQPIYYLKLLKSIRYIELCSAVKPEIDLAPKTNTIPSFPKQTVTIIECVDNAIGQSYWQQLVSSQKFVYAARIYVYFSVSISVPLACHMIDDLGIWGK